MHTGIHMYRLGQVDYDHCWQAMQRKVQTISATHASEIWVVNHPPVYTLGQASDPSHLRNTRGYLVVQTDRGGQVTWHGPGQIILYPLLYLASFGFGPRLLVQLLEQAVIDVLASHGVPGQRRSGAPGVYIDGAKIASIGLRIRKGVSYHGLALNHSNDLEPFLRINPCGYEGLPVTRLIDHASVSLQECTQQLCKRLVELLENGVLASGSGKTTDEANR